MRTMPLRPLLLLSISLASATPSLAQEPRVCAAELALQGARADQAKDFARAAALYQRAVSQGARSAEQPYRGACACALAGDREAAFAMLRRAEALGFHEAGRLREEPALAPLHADPRWPERVAGIEANERRFRAEHSDPEGARFIRSDVELFWRVYAKLPAATDPVGLLNREYLDAGTAGLQDFVPNRILSGANLDATIRQHPRYFAAIRANTLRVADAETAARQSFRRFKALYDDAVFPDVYFVMGTLDSGGTSTSNGLLIGADMFGLGPGVPMDELNAWQREVIHPPDVLPSLIAHELIHFQQTHEGSSLLARAFHEGSADFLASLISGGTFNQAAYAYGYAHEAELWKRFQAERQGTETSAWLYGSSRCDGHPADLGYFMGFRIAQAYYTRTTDKKRAIRDILTSGDFERILKDSHYGENLK